tara:strand:- start:317 stop:580 length:264 start_codon:yes stop_codon:yes gene_type:complete
MDKPKVYIKKNVAVLVTKVIEKEDKYNDFAKVLGDTYDSLIADGWFPQSCSTSKNTLTQIFIRKDKKDEIQRVSIAQQEYPVEVEFS